MILETDVLVVGSGPGGLGVALAAARAGARMALLDRPACFGGNIPQVGVVDLLWYRRERTIDREGIGIEFEERTKATSAAMPERQSLSPALDAEVFKGVQPLSHRLCVAPIVAGRVIRGVITESKSGREEMMAASVMFSMTGASKRRFTEQIKADSQTYKDWTSNGEWVITTSGKEDTLFSLFLRKPFTQAVVAGLIPTSFGAIAGTWGTVTDQGDFTYGKSMRTTTWLRPTSENKVASRIRSASLRNSSMLTRF